MAIPSKIKPMLARGGGHPFDDVNYGFEVKWDGLRCLVIADEPYRLQNRHLKLISDQFPELDFRHIPLGTVIDGEIIALKDGVPSFYALQRRGQMRSTTKIEFAANLNPVTFMAFDLLYEEGKKITKQPLHERRQRLEEIIVANPHDQLRLSDQIIEQGSNYFESVAERGLEGMIAKRLDSPYLEGKRTSGWTKVVAWQTKPLQVLGYVKERNADRIDKIAVGRKQGNSWVYLGKLGHLSEDDSVLLYDTMKNARPLSPIPEGAPSGVQWREVDLRCHTRFFQDTVSGRLRHASFRGWAT